MFNDMFKALAQFTEQMKHQEEFTEKVSTDILAEFREGLNEHKEFTQHTRLTRDTEPLQVTFSTNSTPLMFFIASMAYCRTRRALSMAMQAQGKDEQFAELVMVGIQNAALQAETHEFEANQKPKAAQKRRKPKKSGGSSHGQNVD